MKKTPKKTSAKKPATKAATTKAAKPAAKKARGYTPPPVQGIGWAPFRYPLQ
jgi:hypothetical protein